jgi:hypothetical protein
MQVPNGKGSGVPETKGNSGVPKYAWPESVVLVVAPISVLLVRVIVPMGGGG